MISSINKIPLQPNIYHKNCEIKFKGYTYNPFLEDDEPLEQSLDCLASIGKYGIVANSKYNTDDIIHFYKNTLKSSDLAPIKSQEEYDEILKRVSNYYKPDRTYGISPVNVIRQNYKIYGSSIPHEEFGILPYCGVADVHDNINCLLSGRNLLDMPTETAVDFCRLLDYSLKKVDKKYGTYQGYTYRSGFFSPDVKQFYSSSIVPTGTAKKDLNKNLCIFKVKNGHNINEFQKEYDKLKIFDNEKEILMPRNAEYREITEYTPEIEEKRTAFAKSYADEYNKFWKSNKSIDDIKQNIRVFKEV